MAKDPATPAVNPADEPTATTAADKDADKVSASAKKAAEAIEEALAAEVAKNSTRVSVLARFSDQRVVPVAECSGDDIESALEAATALVTKIRKAGSVSVRRGNTITVIDTAGCDFVIEWLTANR